MKSKEFVVLLLNNVSNILEGEEIVDLQVEGKNSKKNIFSYFRRKIGKLRYE